MDKLIDRVGYWSELKLEIIKKYAQAYSIILSKQTNPRFYHYYIDAFAGYGEHLSKTKEVSIPGSPKIALDIVPPFKEYCFIDIEKLKCQNLKRLADDRQNKVIFEGDCNKILLEKVFPMIDYKLHRRGLCILDPYGLHLDWKIIETAGKMRSIEIFLNFPLGDMNRNVLHKNPEIVDRRQLERMNRFWGDDTWKNVIYDDDRNLFSFVEKSPFYESKLINAFRTRLRKVARFNFVPNPIPMRNRTNTVIYYLFFASPNSVGARIVRDIFNKYKDRMY